MGNSLAVIPRDWSYPILESRSSLENPQTPLSYPAEWLLDIFNGGRTDSGIRVSELIALQVGTLLSCVDLIGGKISSLPFHVYERQISANGRAIHRVAYEHDYYDIVHIEPNEEMTRQTLLKAFLIHCLVWGNGYAEIQRDAGNAAVGIWPLNPSKTHPRRLTQAVRIEAQPWRPFPVTIAAGELVYETTDGPAENVEGKVQDTYRRLIPKEDVLHVPGVSLDGRLGQSTVYLARNTLGLALATEKFGSKYFANFARPGGLLEMPMNLSPEARDKAKTSWMEAQGGENSNRIAVMPPGFKWQAMSNNPDEAQTIPTQQHIRNQIAALFHVPTRMVGDTSRGSKSSTEQENQEFLDYTMSPWISAIKQEFKRKLFPHSGIGRKPKNPFFVDFDVSDMIRGDAASREKFYASGRQWAYLNSNDIRGFEKLNPIEEPWAEQYWIPVNMTLSTTPIDPTFQDGSGQGEVPPDARAYSRLFRDAYDRIVGREKRDSTAINHAFGGILYSIRDLYADLAEREMRVRCGHEESDRFVAEYLGGLTKRAEAWSADRADESCVEELERAAKAIRIAVYREVAGAKAKEPIVIQ